MSEKNKPLETFYAGSVKATVWKNENKDKDEYLTIDIVRIYKDKKDEWQNTSSFRKHDLPKVELVAKKAYEFVFEWEYKNR